MSSLSERMLQRLYASSVGSRLTEPVAQVSPSQAWFRNCVSAGSHPIFMMRWQSCCRTLWQRQPFVTHGRGELTATTELWAAAAKSQPLEIDIYGSRRHGSLWPLYCSVLVFKYREPQL